MFKVVPDQLRISAGWVRCGVCGDVFDAAAGMLPAAQSKELEPLASHSAPTLLAASADDPSSESDFEASSTDGQTPVGESGQADDSVHDTAPVLSDPQVSDELLSEPLIPEPLVSESAPPESVLADSETSDSAVPEPAFHGPSPLEPSDAELDALADNFISAQSYAVGLRPERDGSGDGALQSRPTGYERFDQTLPRADALLMRPARAGSLAEAEEAPFASSLSTSALDQTPAPEPELADQVDNAPYADSAWPPASEFLPEDDAHKGPAADEVEVPSFVRQARRKAFWRSRGVRAFVWLAVALVALALGLYWVLDQRDWLSAREPRLAPLLGQICQPLGCTVEPYRNLNAIVIDGSSFQRGSTSTFQLGFTLRNNDDVPVAMPSLELTLTDAQDQVIVRRALRAQDFSSSRTLSAHGEFSGTSALTVESPDPSTIVGYRLVAFYP